MSDYTQSMLDVRKAVRDEVDAERRAKLQTNLDRIETEHARMSESLTNLRIAAASSLTGDAVRKIAEDAARVLSERVDWLVWMVRSLIAVVVLQILGGLTLAYFVHALGLK